MLGSSTLLVVSPPLSLRCLCAIFRRFAVVKLGATHFAYALSTLFMQRMNFAVHKAFWTGVMVWRWVIYAALVTAHEISGGRFEDGILLRAHLRLLCSKSGILKGNQLQLQVRIRELRVRNLVQKINDKSGQVRVARVLRRAEKALDPRSEIGGCLSAASSISEDFKNLVEICGLIHRPIIKGIHGQGKIEVDER
ncbi:hypothetical protein WNY61_03395 [Sulfitobacter sp. AS92]|uniref:hypothetical protein n=1 Tax=Sulfitobacter sp. AS92 TaxID=3135783 RepID=UPI00317D0002